jgi:hypothetical protein
MALSTQGSLTWWNGWDVRGGASAEPAAIEAFTRSAPDRPGADAHYELLAVAARGFRPPRFVSTDDVPQQDHEDPRIEQDHADFRIEQDHAVLRPTWSMLYRRVAETGPPTMVPHAIYLLGVDPPVDATDDDLAVFNAFYTDVHLPEVAERRHALRAERYELVREAKPPYQGAPRFLAVYEVDEQAASNRRHVGPPYTRGPEIWQRHKTPWRLWYRRLAPADSVTGAGD